jgi:transcriptional regulator with XRE-family HTH domain
MARPRPAAGTPFGAWLNAWFLAHPDVTFEAFADEVGVSKSAVSLWISATRPVQVKPATLRRVAVYTDEPLGNLEQLVYGLSRRSGAGTEPLISLTSEELEALMERAAELAVRKVLEGRSA